MIYADMFIDMKATGQADGTTMTSAIFATCVQARENAGFNTVPDPGTGLTVNAHQLDALDDVCVRDIGTFKRDYNARTLQLNNTTNFIYAQLWTDTLASGTTKKMSMGGWVRFGPPDNTTGKLYDMIQYVAIGSGVQLTFQLNNGSAPTTSGYAVNLETSPGGVTTHSAYIEILPATTYWVSLLADYVTGLGQCALFDTAGVLVGTIQNAPFDGASSNIQEIRFGNNEIGNDAGTTWFQSVVLDYRQARWPLGPIGSDAKFPNSGNRPRGFAPGVAR